MHIWIDLITREAAFVLTLLLLGAGPAAFLSSRCDKATRLALAPALGLCLGVAVTTTLLQWTPVHSTYWVIIVLAIVSTGVAMGRVARRGARIRLPLRELARIRLPLRELAQIVVLAIAVLGPASLTLHARASVGPVELNVADAAGYVPEIDAQQTLSINKASALAPPYRDLTEQFWVGYSRGFQNVDVTPLEASVNDILGLHATDTQSPFMIALIFVGALGAFAAYRYLTRSRSWAAVLAGVLFGGPFFMQLWADSSEAAICGLSLMLPFVVVGIEALRGRRLRDCVLLALLAAGLLSVYPLFVPEVAFGSVIVLALVIARTVFRSRPTRRDLLAVSLRLVLLIGLAAAFTPVAFARDLRYYQAILNGAQSFSGLPIYHLPLGVLPGWLLQTREFYDLPSLGDGGTKQLLFAVVLPLVLLAVIVWGLRWQRRAAVLAPFAAVCALLAEYVSVHNHCSYCVQRNLLPVAPIAAFLLAVGVGALFAAGTRLGRVAGALAALVIVLAVGERMRIERTRILETAYFLDSANRSVLDHLPGHSTDTVEVEGFGENPRGPAEMPLVYDLVNERTNGHASMAMEAPDYQSFAYLGPPDQPAALNPRYEYVLTRFAGLGTDRALIARSGAIALEKRVQRLDVTPVADLGVPLARLDPDGFTWIQGGVLGEPLLLYVTGGIPGTAVWVHLEIALKEQVGIPPQRGVTTRRRGGRLSVCIRASGLPPVQRAKLTLAFTPIAGPEPAGELFTLPQPAEGVQLLSMSTGSRCVP